MIRSLRSLLALLPAVLLSTSLFAQSGVVLVFRSDAPIDGMRAKQAMEAIKALDHQAIASWEADVLKVRIDGGIGLEQVVHALNQGDAVYAAMSDDPRTGMPIRIDTGDPAGDDLRYQQAKAAWLQAHPQPGNHPSPAKD